MLVEIGDKSDSYFHGVYYRDETTSASDSCKGTLPCVAKPTAPRCESPASEEDAAERTTVAMATTGDAASVPRP